MIGWVGLRDENLLRRKYSITDHMYEDTYNTFY